MVKLLLLALTVAIDATALLVLAWRFDPKVQRLRAINREVDSDYDDRLLAVLFGRWWRRWRR